MKRFEFRLASVLRLRQVQLEAEQAKLQELLGEQQRLLRDLEAAAAERREAKEAVYSLINLDNAELRTMSAFLLGVDARTAKTHARLAEMARFIEERRQCVIKAERKVRLLEKLREGKRAEWKHEADLEVETAAQEAWLSARHLRLATAGAKRAVARDISPLDRSKCEVQRGAKPANGRSDSAAGSR